MRILVAPDCFTGTLTAQEAADAMAEGWTRGAPHDTCVRLPLADGGPGFVSAVQAGLGGEPVPVTVTGPLGEPTPAVVLLVPTAAGPVAYVESAQAQGLHLVPADRRDPARTTSAGVGELLAAALDLGARRVVVGLGGSATNDAGAGMLAALGAGEGGPGAGGAGSPGGDGAPPAATGAWARAGLGVGGPGRDALLRGGGGGLGGIRTEHLAGLAGLRRRLAGIDLVAACDVDVPLLGLHGTSAGFAPQKGATAEGAQALERALGHFSHVAATALGDDAPRRDLLAPGARRPAGRDLTQLPGSGAAGGVGFGLALLGARVLPGAQVVADALGLAGHVAAADVVLTGEGALDWQSLHGKVVSAVAAEGLRHGVPVVAVAGQVTIGRREWGAAGIAGAYAVAERPGDVAAAMADPRGTLVARVERVARTWSR